MWEKCARVCNYIDIVCDTFDQQYERGSDPSRPGNLPGNMGKVLLPSLYAFFVDEGLRGTEETAARRKNAPY